jgi:hypothetical protein
VAHLVLPSPPWGSGQFFFLLFDPELVTAGRNLMDGRYGTFGCGHGHVLVGTCGYMPRRVLLAVAWHATRTDGKQAVRAQA